MVHKRQKVRRQNGNNNVREAKQSWKCVNTNPQKCGEQRSSAMVAPLSPKEDGDYVQQKVEGQSSTTTGWPSESERLIQSIPSQETKVIRVTCPEKTENQRKLSLAIGSPDPPTKFTTNHDVKSSSSSANNDLQHGVTEDTELPVSSTASRSKKAVLGNVTNQSSTEFIRITTNDSCMLNNGNTGSTDSSADVSELQTTTNTKSLSEIQGSDHSRAKKKRLRCRDTRCLTHETPAILPRALAIVTKDTKHLKVWQILKAGSLLQQYVDNVQYLLFTLYSIHESSHQQETYGGKCFDSNTRKDEMMHICLALQFQADLVFHKDTRDKYLPHDPSTRKRLRSTVDEYISNVSKIKETPFLDAKPRRFMNGVIQLNIDLRNPRSTWPEIRDRIQELVTQMVLLANDACKGLTELCRGINKKGPIHCENIPPFHMWKHKDRNLRNAMRNNFLTVNTLQCEILEGMFVDNVRRVDGKTVERKVLKMAEMIAGRKSNPVMKLIKDHFHTNILPHTNTKVKNARTHTYLYQAEPSLPNATSLPSKETTLPPQNTCENHPMNAEFSVVTDTVVEGSLGLIMTILFWSMSFLLVLDTGSHETIHEDIVLLMEDIFK